jgi:hypothetical protein
VQLLQLLGERLALTFSFGSVNLNELPKQPSRALAVGRMTLPKDDDSMRKIQEEIEREHHHHHHEHHHGELGDVLIYILETLGDLKERVKMCEQNVDDLQRDIRTLYKVIVFIMKALLSEGDDRKEALEEALQALERKI